MGLGQGIQNAGNLFAQAILAKHEEEQRLQREALAQTNEEADRQFRYDQLDRMLAKDQYDQQWRTLSNAPLGASIDQSTYDQLDPGLRQIYTKPQQAVMGMPGITQPSATTPTGRHDIVSPYGERERIADTNAAARAKLEADKIASRERIAALRQQLTPYQRALIEAQKDNTGIKKLQLDEAIRWHDALLSNRDSNNMLDAQTAWDIAVERAKARYPDYKPTTKRPGSEKIPSGPVTPKTIDWSKVEFK